MEANTKRRRTNIWRTACGDVASGVPAGREISSSSSRRLEPRRQELKKEDADLGHATDGNENRKEDEKTRLVQQATSQAPFSKNPSFSYSLPWGESLPELVDYYLHNPFDFTGVNLYAVCRTLKGHHEYGISSNANSVSLALSACLG